MKTLFIEARYDNKIKLPDAVIAQLSKNYDKVALFTTVQFLDSLPALKKQLEDKNVIVELLKPLHCKYEGQLLGCSISNFRTDADAFLYIGDGMFHPIALKLYNLAGNKPVFAYNPFTKKLAEITENDTKKMQLQQKAALVKFHSSKEIGILVSTKPGQNNMKKAHDLERKYPDKKFYLLLFDTLDFAQLENFNFIECFVNTACPRISYDDSEKFAKKVVDVNLL